MAKKLKFRWRPEEPLMVNLERAIAAQNAAKEWTAARRAKHSKAAFKRHKREKRERIARMVERAKMVAEAKRTNAGHANAPVGSRKIDRVLRAMIPGEWMAAADVADLSGIDRPTVARFLRVDMIQRRPEAALAEKAANEAYQGQPLASHVPKLLWRLTEAGLEARDLAVMLE